MASKKLLLVTGVSSGFGRALAQQALADGHRVAGTVRPPRPPKRSRPCAPDVPTRACST
jgi:NAD(P)-dependent dehydrogenase (short-subunit alcohol dehydrogenase family)